MKNSSCKICLLGIVFNIVLFFIKLYVGLSSNSISIYSDSVNNLFDSLSAVLSLMLILFVLKGFSHSRSFIYERVQYFLSFCLSVVVFITGALFFYSSVERLMYPTPVWYTDRYFYILVLSAVSKVLMYFLYKRISKKDASPIGSVMAFDCILDFFVTSIAVAGLVISKSGNYAFDSIAGIIVSLVLCFGAVKLLLGNLSNLLCVPKKQDVEALDEILASYGASISVNNIFFTNSSGEFTVHLDITAEEEITRKLKDEIEEKACVKVEWNR